MTDDLIMFEHGTATLLNTTGKYAVIKCCHCGGHHAHEKRSIGSRSVLAVCSNTKQPRTYAIPAQASKKR